MNTTVNSEYMETKRRIGVVLFSLCLITTMNRAFFAQSKSSEIKIGNQIWSGENLGVKKFKNGDLIYEAKSSEDWMKYCSEQKPAWCYYENDPEYGEKFGILYNIYAVMDERGLAPDGWHIPTKTEWDQLNEFLGKSESGSKMKSEIEWSKGLSSNVSKFSAVPSGFRYGTGEFMQIDVDCYFWAYPNETDKKEKNTYLQSSDVFFLTENSTELTWSRIDWGVGYSVRCIKNQY